MEITYETKLSIKFDSETELQTCLRGATFMQGQVNAVPSFSSAQSTVKQISASTINQLGSINDAEKRCIVNVLKNTATKTDAANMLGIERATLYSKIDKYGIDYEALRNNEV